MKTTSRSSSDRGAILLQVAIAIIVLIGFGAFVVDYGVMLVGRRQAQNAADAGALAGAIAMAFDAGGWTDRTPTGPARSAAHLLALSHGIWWQPPNVNIETDVYFTDTPAPMTSIVVRGLPMRPNEGEPGSSSGETTETA